MNMGLLRLPLLSGCTLVRTFDRLQRGEHHASTCVIRGDAQAESRRVVGEDGTDVGSGVTARYLTI
jgi:hypothetical protein